MDLIFTHDEKDLFRKLQKLNSDFARKLLNSRHVEKILIKHIILNRFARLNINPTLGQFDAFIDDIEAYLDKSTNVFASFLQEDKSEDKKQKSK